MNGGVDVRKYRHTYIKEYLEFFDIYEWENVNKKFLIQNEHKTFTFEAPSFRYPDLSF